MTAARMPVALAACALLLAACDGGDGGGGDDAGLGSSFGSFFASAFNGGTVSATADPIDFDGRPVGFPAVDPTADPIDF